MGTIVNVSKDIDVFFSADAGGKELSILGSTILKFPLNSKLTLGFLLGPELDVIERPLLTSEKIYYMGAATGLILDIRFRENISAFYAMNYFTNEKSESQLKIGIGVILWLPDNG
jgi:hypothetical protein